MPILHGGQLFLSGLKLALSPKLRRYIIVPATISILTFSMTLILVVLPLAGDAGDWLQNHLPNWLSWLQGALVVLTYITLGLAGFLLTSLLVNLLAAPFLGQLAQATWVLSKPNAVTPPGPRLLASIGPSILRELTKMRYHLPRLLVLLLLSLVPGLNAVMPVVWLGFSAWLMAVQFADYASENQLHTFTFTLQKLAHARVRALGFGACASLALAIPFLNFLAIPAAVVGGTLLWQSIIEEQPS